MTTARVEITITTIERLLEPHAIFLYSTFGNYFQSAVIKTVDDCD